jgi:hypothetical protein
VDVRSRIEVMTREGGSSSVGGGTRVGGRSSGGGRRSVLRPEGTDEEALSASYRRTIDAVIGRRACLIINRIRRAPENCVTTLLTAAPYLGSSAGFCRSRDGGRRSNVGMNRVVEGTGIEALLANCRRTRVATLASTAPLLSIPQARLALKNCRTTRVCVALLLVVVAGDGIVGRITTVGRSRVVEGTGIVNLLASYRRALVADMVFTAHLLIIPQTLLAHKNCGMTLVLVARLFVAMAADTEATTEHGEEETRKSQEDEDDLHDVV